MEVSRGLRLTEAEFEALKKRPPNVSLSGKQIAAAVPRRLRRSPLEIQLACQMDLAGMTYLSEHRFTSERKWRVDFAWPEQMLAVEVEGGIWRRGGGAHSHPSNIERDIEKQNALDSLGWRLIRVTRKMIESGEALSLIREALK